MGESGRKASIKLDNVIIRGLGDWNLTRTAKEIDDSEFGNEYEKYDVGMKGAKGDFKGKVRLTDAGQTALEEAYATGALIADLRFYINETVYWAPDTVTDSEAGARLTSLKIGTKLDGVATADYAVSFSGPVKQFGV